VRAASPASRPLAVTHFRSLTSDVPVSDAGKVHGSLARAGKVRGGAPKVEKQDKKKLPKGRAFQRLKYNRRFVNVGAAPCVSPVAAWRDAEAGSTLSHWRFSCRTPTPFQ
jgi:small subunit ribosomal protein S30e